MATTINNGKYNCSWLEYNEEKSDKFCKLCQNFMKNEAKVP